MSLTAVLKECTSSVDCDNFIGYPADWIDLMMIKVSPELIMMMHEEGQKTPIAYYNEELGNGHHRLTAALLLGWDAIEVVDKPNDSYDPTGWECLDQDSDPTCPDVQFIQEALWETMRSLVND